MISAPFIQPCSGGIVLTHATPASPAADSQHMLEQLEVFGLAHCTVLTKHEPEDPCSVATRFHLSADLAQTWAPGFDTLGLAARLQLDTERHPSELDKEIVLAMLLGPQPLVFPGAAEFASSVRIRRNIVLAARQTALAFYTEEADRPDDCWTYDDERGFTVRPGHALIAALQKATQPGPSGKRYAFSCYRATEYVMLLAIAQELESANPALLVALQRQWERRAIKSEEFRTVFLREHGSVENPLPPSYYVPGDRVWFRNPDPYSCNTAGYEGSWLLYLGGGLFTNFWTEDPPYTLRSKCLEMFQWRYCAYIDDVGEMRMDESKVTARLDALKSDPAQAEQILQTMLRLREPERSLTGGCLDATREYPLGVCAETSELLMPDDEHAADSTNGAAVEPSACYLINS